MLRRHDHTERNSLGPSAHCSVIRGLCGRATLITRTIVLRDQTALEWASIKKQNRRVDRLIIYQARFGAGSGFIEKKRFQL